MNKIQLQNHAVPVCFVTVTKLQSTRLVSYCTCLYINFTFFQKLQTVSVFWCQECSWGHFPWVQASQLCEMLHLFKWNTHRYMDILQFWYIFVMLVLLFCSLFYFYKNILLKLWKGKNTFNKYFRMGIILVK